MNSIRIVLDTNIWIFGLAQQNTFCELIFSQATNLKPSVPEQVRAEIQNSLPSQLIPSFYRTLFKADIAIDASPVSADLLAKYHRLGLKKGDAVIGAYCEWRGIDILVSDNRDFLRGITRELPFEIMSPEEFCEFFGLI